VSTSSGFHHGDLKAALARSAADLVEKSGTEALSLREVARAAGVSTAAPYRHYLNKEALLAEVARQGFMSMHDELVEIGSGQSEHEAFLSQCIAYVRFAERRPALYRLMFGPFPDKPRHPGLIEAGERLFALLDAPLRKAGDRQALRAIGCWAFVHGLAMLALDDQLKAHMPGTSDEHLREIILPLAQTMLT